MWPASVQCYCESAIRHLRTSSSDTGLLQAVVGPLLGGRKAGGRAEEGRGRALAWAGWPGEGGRSPNLAVMPDSYPRPQPHGPDSGCCSVLGLPPAILQVQF